MATKKILKREQLHDYQVATVEHIMENDNCALFLEMGLGKTVSTLTAIADLIQNFTISSVLVIAPKRVAETVWTNEIKKWAHVSHLTTSRVIGNAKQRIHALKEPADIHLISRDNVQWLCAHYGGHELPFDMCVIDESSSFKNHKAKRFKTLRMVQHCFDRMVQLTGTPTPKGIHDIWAQIYLLDGGERLGRFITKFEKEYLSRSYDGFSFDCTDSNMERIYAKLRDICISMKAKDYLTLPERIDNEITITMPPALKTQYDDFQKEKILEFIEDQMLFSMTGEVEITAENAAALSGKLLQFANGAVYDNEENKQWHEVHNLKIDALESVLEEANGQPVLVATAFRHDTERIMSKLKRFKPQKLETEQDIEDWNEGKIPVMLMHPASGGHGLNLQDGGNIIVWFGINWSLELYMQFNARLHRQGQTKPTYIHHLIVEGTRDKRVMSVLAGREDAQEDLMRAVKAEVKQMQKLLKK